MTEVHIKNNFRLWKAFSYGASKQQRQSPSLQKVYDITLPGKTSRHIILQKLGSLQRSSEGKILEIGIQVPHSTPNK